MQHLRFLRVIVNCVVCMLLCSCSTLSSLFPSQHEKRLKTYAKLMQKQEENNNSESGDPEEEKKKLENAKEETLAAAKKRAENVGVKWEKKNGKYKPEITVPEGYRGDISALLASNPSPEASTVSPTPNFAPPISRAKKAELEQRLTETALMIEAVGKKPEMKHQAALIKVTQDETNPYVTQATFLLRNYKTKDSYNALLKVIKKSSLKEMRRMALLSMSYVNINDTLKFCRKLINTQDEATLRATAATIIGQNRDKKSIKPLQKMLYNSSPEVAFVAAKALTECGDKRSALKFYYATLNAGDPTYIPQALSFLVKENDPEVAKILLVLLRGHNRALSIVAARAMNAIDQSVLQEAINSIPVGNRAFIVERQEMLLYLEGEGGEPQNLSAVLKNGAMPDKNLAILSLQKSAKVRNIPALIEATAVNNKEIQLLAYKILDDLIEKHRLASAPEETTSSQAWVKWWIRQHKVLATRKNRALVYLPDGQTRELSLGSTLDFSFRVKRITTGFGENNLNGAKVEISNRANSYLLQP